MVHSERERAGATPRLLPLTPPGLAARSALPVAVRTGEEGRALEHLSPAKAMPLGWAPGAERSLGWTLTIRCSHEAPGHTEASFPSA